MMMRLANGVERAQEERLDVPAFVTAPQQVSRTITNGRTSIS